MRMSVENGIVAFIVLVLVLVLVVVVELVIEGLEDEDEDEDDYDIAAFTNNSIFSASRTLKSEHSQCFCG